MKPVFARIQQLFDERIPAAVATVVESSGSTPRKPGSRMIIFPDGNMEGTVGGGALEKTCHRSGAGSNENRRTPADLY